MPKQDRALQMKKENANVRKRVTADAAKAQKDAEQTEKEEAAAGAEAEKAAKAKKAPPSKFDEAMRHGKANSNFAQASGIEESSDDDVGNEPVAPVRAPAGKAEPPSSGKKGGKKQKAGSFQDEILQMEQEKKAAKFRRIQSRFLQLMIVGLFMNFDEDDKSPKPAQKEGKPKKKNGKKDADDSEGLDFGRLREKFAGPIMMVLFVCVVFGARIAGEDFSVDLDFENQANFYDVIGVPSDVDVIALRKTYKKLALELHPDKNPDCAECAERFSKISKAYETLSDPERRKAYDQRKTTEGKLKTATSVDLTDEDFEAQVFRSNEVWYVQIFDPSEGLAKNFHPVWEEVAANHEHIAKFGRLDMTKNRRAMSLLPQRVLMTPVVFRFARGSSPELFQWTWSAEERGGQPFARFVLDNFPALQRFEEEAPLKKWWEAATADRPRIVVTGAGKTNSLEFMQVQRLVHMWAGFFDVAVANPRVVRSALGDSLDPKYEWVVALRGVGSLEEMTKRALDVEYVAGALQEVITKGLSFQAPQLTVRNYQQLCGTHGPRNICLFMVGQDAKSASAAVAELNDSRTTYAAELAEVKAADDEESESTEEALNIQLVRVQPQNSRLPWEPVALSRAFNPLWKEAEYNSRFALDLDSRRVARITSSSLSEVYQSIAYDDVKFSDVPEEVASSLHRVMPDPEVGLRQEFNHLLMTVPGMLIAFLFAAVTLSVVPELELAESGAFVSGAVVLVAALWPLASRKMINIVWCMSSSAFECQLS